MAELPTVDEMLPTIPDGWERRATRSVDPPGSMLLYHRGKKLASIMTTEIHGDGSQWWHVSVSHPRRIPSWLTMSFVKESLMGEETLAVQIHPPRSQWVNHAETCLHLWVRLDEPTIGGTP